LLDYVKIRTINASCGFAAAAKIHYPRRYFVT